MARKRKTRDGCVPVRRDPRRNARAHRVANALQAGSVWINDYNVTPPEVPFGGYKQSGVGRENGMATIEHFTQLKTIYATLDDFPASF